MGRLTAIAIAGAVLALGCAERALADQTPPAPATPAPAPALTSPISGQAHLVFRSDDRADAIEGRVTVVERRSGVTVVEELSSACDEACARRRLALADTPEPPVRE
jgi:hypothetical protein